MEDDETETLFPSEQTTRDDPPRPARPSSTSLGERYRIVKRLAKGGMGEIMIARDDQIGRDVAIKRMRTGDPSERAVERFLREATIQGRLAHPAIVNVHEIGRDANGQPFFVMERLDAETLSEILGRGLGTDRLRVLRAFVDVCLAVEFAHVRGVIHRDLKPPNIMLGNFGETYVLDWGVAKVLGSTDSDLADVGSGDSGEHATEAGTMIGTRGYMAPEQARGDADIDGRADVYALGCILFEILAGEPLHPGGVAGVASTLAGTEARPSRRKPGVDIAPELDELCVAATALDRDRRIATARELGERVQRYLDGDRDLALRRELAQAHLERATAAFLSGDDAQRGTAMREAGRALALDPSGGGAAELVTRLMLEPPTTMPAEVERAIEEDNNAASRANSRFGVWAYLAFLAFTPLLWWIAPAGSAWIVAAVSGLIATNVVVCWMQSTAPRPRPWLIAATNAIMVALISRMFTPFLIAPAVAAVIAMGIVLSQRLSRLVAAGAIVGLMSAAVLVPWFLELAGVMSQTTFVIDGGLILKAIGVSGPGAPTLVVAALYVVLLLTVACSLADAMRTRERAAKRHLLLQTWQLHQLVRH
jgi:serine/threonine-protein kinase